MMPNAAAIATSWVVHASFSTRWDRDAIHVSRVKPIARIARQSSAPASHVANTMRPTLHLSEGAGSAGEGVTVIVSDSTTTGAGGTARRATGGGGADRPPKATCHAGAMRAAAGASAAHTMAAARTQWRSDAERVRINAATASATTTISDTLMALSISRLIAFLPFSPSRPARRCE